MIINNQQLELILSMTHSHVKNYVIPGLTSSLINSPSDSGLVRIFQNERDHQENIIPHSHRFDFVCTVLRGHVINRVWSETRSDEFDLYSRKINTYKNEIGEYDQEDDGVSRYEYIDTQYEIGQSYSMKAEEIHSIQFSRGAVVLFFECAKKSQQSVILEPYVDGKIINTFEVKDWMFKK